MVVFMSVRRMWKASLRFSIKMAPSFIEQRRIITNNIINWILTEYSDPTAGLFGLFLSLNEIVTWDIM